MNNNEKLVNNKAYLLTSSVVLGGFLFLTLPNNDAHAAVNNEEGKQGTFSNPENTMVTQANNNSNFQYNYSFNSGKIENQNKINFQKNNDGKEVNSIYNSYSNGEKNFINNVNPDKKYFDSYLDEPNNSKLKYNFEENLNTDLPIGGSSDYYTDRSIEPYASAQWLTNHTLTAGFGHYNLNINNGMHYGADFAMPIGTPVQAITGGKIIEAGWSPIWWR